MLEELCTKHELRDLPGLGARVEERVLWASRLRARFSVARSKLRLADALLLAERLLTELKETLGAGEVDAGRCGTAT